MRKLVVQIVTVTYCPFFLPRLNIECDMYARPQKGKDSVVPSQCIFNRCSTGEMLMRFAFRGRPMLLRVSMRKQC